MRFPIRRVAGSAASLAYAVALTLVLIVWRLVRPMPAGTDRRLDARTL